MNNKIIPLLLFQILLNSCTSKENEGNADNKASQNEEIDSISNSGMTAGITDSTDLSHNEIIDTLPMFDWEEFQKWRFESPVGETILDFQDFQLVIEGTFDFDDSASMDTVQIYEDVGNYVYGKLIEIKPAYNHTDFQLFLHVKEVIHQHWDGTGDYYDWKKTAVKWKGESSEIVEDSLGYYRLPVVNSLNGYFEVKRERKLSLRDTIVNHSGESQNIGSLIYKGKVCNYNLTYAVLEIVATNNRGQKSSSFVKIIFSNGC